MSKFLNVYTDNDKINDILYRNFGKMKNYELVSSMVCGYMVDIGVRQFENVTEDELNKILAEIDKKEIDEKEKSDEMWYELGTNKVKNVRVVSSDIEKRALKSCVEIAKNVEFTDILKFLSEWDVAREKCKFQKVCKDIYFSITEYFYNNKGKTIREIDKKNFYDVFGVMPSDLEELTNEGCYVSDDDVNKYLEGREADSLKI